MSQSLQQFAARINRIASTWSEKPGIVSPLPESLFRVGGRVMGNVAQLDRFVGQRKAAPIVQYGADPVIHTPNGMTRQPVTLLHSYTDMPIDPQSLLAFASNDAEAQEVAVGVVARKIADHKESFKVLRTKAMISAFSKGKIWVGPTGELLASASGAISTIDYGVATTDTVSASWATASTNIVGDIAAIKRTRLIATGERITTAYYGKNIAGYIGANTVAKELIHGDSALSRAYYETGEIPNGFCKLNWVPVHETYTFDKDGNPQSWFGDNQITFTADPAADWYGGIIEGSKVSNRGMGGTAETADQLLPMFEHIYGAFSYAFVHQGPNAKISQIGGDTFLPAIKNGGCVSIVADVTTP